MTDFHIEKDEAAIRVYGKRYKSLSAWGQSQIDHIVAMIEDKQTKAPYRTTLDDVNDIADNERKVARIRVLEQENEELWMENTELKTENAELRKELNLPDGDSL